MASINRLATRVARTLMHWIKGNVGVAEPFFGEDTEALQEMKRLVAQELSKDQPTAEQLQAGPPVTFLLNVLAVTKQVQKELDYLYDHRHEIDDNVVDSISILRNKINQVLKSYEYEKGEIIPEEANQTYYNEIQKVHPLETGQYRRYELALKLVGERHGKYELVDLVNWLLTNPKLDEAGKLIPPNP